MQTLSEEIDAVDRELVDDEHDGKPGKALSLTRTFPASRDRLWTVLTEAGHLDNWFLPVAGDLQEGGSYAFEGNAGGDVVECVGNERFRVTWAYGGGPPSLVDVELEGDGDGCQVQLTHTVDAEMFEGLIAEMGPEGTAGVGAGWDASLLQLAFYLDGHEPVPVVDAEDAPPEMQEAMAAATAAWVELFEPSDWGA